MLLRKRDSGSHSSTSTRRKSRVPGSAASAVSGSTAGPATGSPCSRTPQWLAVSSESEMCIQCAQVSAQSSHGCMVA